MRGQSIVFSTFISIALAVFFLVATNPSRVQNQRSGLAMWGDPFCYMRGADLIQKEGLIDGLDTSIKTPDARFLIKAAIETGIPVEKWFDIITPYCHHYDKSTDKIIMQYPPGTGLLMSLLPRGHAAFSYNMFYWLVTIAVAASCVYGAPSLIYLIIMTCLLAASDQLMSLAEMAKSYSIPWSMALIPGLALATLRLHQLAGIRQLILAAALGTALGTFWLIRLPNIFIVAGIFLFLAHEGRIWDFAAPNRRHRALVTTGAFFAITGPFILGYTNWVNTGSPFRTTYTVSDATAPDLSWQVIYRNARMYLYDSSTANFVDTVVVITLIYSIFSVIYRKNESLKSKATCAIFVATISILFFVTHPISTEYYLLPSMFFVVFFLAFSVLSQGVSVNRPKWVAPLVLSGFVVLLALQFPKAPTPPPFSMHIPDEVLAPTTVVWATLSSGSLLYYNDKYAGTLYSGEQVGNKCVIPKLIQQIYADGGIQYFIVDTFPMAVITAKLAEFGKLTNVGKYEFIDNFDVLRLDHIGTLPDCLD